MLLLALVSAVASPAAVRPRPPPRAPTAPTTERATPGQHGPPRFNAPTTTYGLGYAVRYAERCRCAGRATAPASNPRRCLTQQPEQL